MDIWPCFDNTTAALCLLSRSAGARINVDIPFFFFVEAVLEKLNEGGRRGRWQRGKRGSSKVAWGGKWGVCLRSTPTVRIDQFLVIFFLSLARPDSASGDLERDTVQYRQVHHLDSTRARRGFRTKGSIRYLAQFCRSAHHYIILSAAFRDKAVPKPTLTWSGAIRSPCPSLFFFFFLADPFHFEQIPGTSQLPIVTWALMGSRKT